MSVDDKQPSIDDTKSDSGLADQLEQDNSRLIEALQQCMQKKQTEYQEKRDLVHDMNQPLFAIRNYLSVCRHRMQRLDGYDDTKQKHLVGAIQRALNEVDRAAEILKRVKRDG